MKKKYLEYSIEKLLQDRKFIKWILRGEKNKKWNNFLLEYPDFNTKVQQAREIFFHLKDSYKELNETDIKAMWENIDHFNKNEQKEGRIIVLKRVFRYAAVLLAIITIGFTSYWFLGRSVESHEFTFSDTEQVSNEARFILSTGEQVLLEKDNSSIVIDGDEKILINDDRSIKIQDSQKASDETIAMNEVIIPYGKKSYIVLDDGTKVWLNAGSRLAFPTKFSGNKREVYLEGEAYFEVTHAPEKPFFVNAQDISVKVLGTCFDISAYKADSDIITILLEGSVSINEKTARSLSKNEIILKPHQKASFIKDTKQISVEQETDAYYHIAWTKGYFEFYHENLSEVLKKLERYYNARIEFISDFHSTDLITGKLDLKESLNDIMITLSDVAEIDFQINDNNVIIYNKNMKMNE